MQQVNINLITSSIIEAAHEHCRPVEDDAECIAAQYRKLFTLFARCHNLYSSAKAMDESTITTLGTNYLNLNRQNRHVYYSPWNFTVSLILNVIPPVEQNIKDFMAAYRLAEKRVTPKLHILEEHIIPWIRRWHVGVGFHSEQGAESIHAHFNTLLRTYASTRNSTKKLERVMKEHYLKNTPQNLASIPAIKRKRKNWYSTSTLDPRPLHYLILYTWLTSFQLK